MLIPAGVFVSGTIWMRSHVELHLAHGARLQASTRLEDYNQEDAFPQNQSCPEEEWNGKHLLIAYQCQDIAVTGTGVIDGSGPFFFAPPVKIWEYLWWEGLALAKDKENLRPGQMLVMVECTRVPGYGCDAAKQHLLVLLLPGLFLCAGERNSGVQSPQRCQHGRH